ncbi:L,D-transpeptidase [Paeniglutamicibacter sp.]|uniref:L,D-transpeptidase n=1 Tax=Paeniglutamicibacter sp. TaxID=1934391 RepID=UPI0039891802
MRPPRSLASLAATIALTGLLLAGCSAPPADPAPVASTAATQTSAAPTAVTTAVLTPNEVLRTLPWATTYEVYGKAAPADPGTPFAGLVASLPQGAGYVIAYAAPGKKAFALIGPEQLSDKTALPVVNKRAGWVQVLIPGRRNLPSSGEPVNGATAWLEEADVTLTDQPEEVVLDLSEGTVTLLSGKKTVDSYSILMDGKDLTARGVRGYAVSSYWNEAQKACSSEKLLAVSVQSDVYDAFADGVSIQAIHGWSKECRAVSSQTARSSGCINLSDAAMKKLLARIKPGTPITFNS